MLIKHKSIRGHGAVMLEFRRRTKAMTQTEIAKASGASVQAVCDVVKGRRPPNAELLRWLGFEVAYVPRVPMGGARTTATDTVQADRIGVAPQTSTDSASADAPPAPEV